MLDQCNGDDRDDDTNPLKAMTEMPSNIAQKERDQPLFMKRRRYMKIWRRDLTPRPRGVGSSNGGRLLFMVYLLYSGASFSPVILTQKQAGVRLGGVFEFTIGTFLY